MPLSRVFQPITALARKCKPLLWLMLVSGLMGIAAFMEPVDLALLTLRNKIRAQPVSGEVVVVGIDDESIAATGPWPWDRARLAALTDRLVELRMTPPLDSCARYAYVRLAGRTEAPVMQVLRRFAAERLRD